MFLFIFWESVFSFICLVWLLLWPFCGTIWGDEVVVRQSIYFLVFCITCDSIRNILNKISSIVGYLFGGLIEIAVLSFLFLQPFTLLPSFVVSAYSFILKYIAEIFFVFIEIKQILGYIRKSGTLFNELIYDNEEKDWLFKFFVILIASVSTVVGSLFMINGLLITSYTIFTHLSIILFLLNIGSLIATLCKDEGIISNFGLVYFVSGFFVYVAIVTSLPREVWNVAPIDSSDKPLLYQILEIPEKTTVYANDILHWVKRNYGFWFWSMFLIRLFLCLTWIYSESDESDLNDSDVLERFQWPSFELKNIDKATVAKVVAVSIYTQMIIVNTPLNTSSSFFSLNFGTVSKLAQSFLLCISYVSSLLSVSS